jgi:hypothetical protein
MEVVDVQIKKKVPVSFSYRQKSYDVEQISECWRETGRWWDSEEPAELYEVQTATGRFLLIHQVDSTRWYGKRI